MQLNVNRFFSDRLVFDDALPEKFRVANSFWDCLIRIISWIWSPCFYSDENRRTIVCFKKYLVDTLGEGRLQRICTRYSLDLDVMARKGSPLLSRDVAKIVIGANNVTVQDLDERGKRFEGLDKASLAEALKTLSNPFEGRWQVADIAKKIGGGPSEKIAQLIYDPFLADRERLQLSRGHPTNVFEVFVNNMVARIIKKEMDVGTLIPAPNHPDGSPQFYYVSAKIVTGEGMVSYIFHPATADTNLKPMRLFRGTSRRNSEIDGISTLITAFERNLGRTAYESGQGYERIIQEKLGQPTIEGGHSMGSTLVQYRLANMEHIREAYLFCGPGLPKEEMEKFNEKNQKVTLIIRQAAKDKWSSTGGLHLGYRAPSNVRVEFGKHHPPKKGFNDNLHVAVWGKDHKFYGIEGMNPEDRDRELNHENTCKERIRSIFGPPVACILRQVRNMYRNCFSSRAELERGLKIGSLQNGRWQVAHFRTI